MLLPPIKGMHGDALEVPRPFMNAVNKISAKSGKGVAANLDNKTENKLKFTLLYFIWALILCSTARPQIVGEPIQIRSYSREILLVVDISTSMLEPDFKIDNKRSDRLTVVKKTISDFIKKRTDDKIGLIFFGTNAYLQSPITYDKKSLEEILYAVDAGMAGNSTAIGDALGLALKTLRKGEDLEKKVIILLTDGENNDGSINLAEAIDLAGKEGIKVYTIGVGTDGALIQSMFGFNIKVGSSGLDEKSLKEIAEATKGTYFKASDTKSLEKVYDTIDNMEPSANEDIYIQEVKELYYIPLSAALLFALILVLWTRRYKR
jgi:Ca-activated chloride channel family protein